MYQGVMYVHICRMLKSCVFLFFTKFLFLFFRKFPIFSYVGGPPEGKGLLRSCRVLSTETVPGAEPMLEYPKVTLYLSSWCEETNLNYRIEGPPPAHRLVPVWVGLNPMLGVEPGRPWVLGIALGDPNFLQGSQELLSIFSG